MDRKRKLDLIEPHDGEEVRGAERGRRAAGSESSSQRGQDGDARRLWKVAVMKVHNIAS